MRSKDNMKGRNISELVELSQSGDESAFEILFKTFQTRLHHSLFKVLRNYHETEDIVQQAFMRAWEKIGTFKGEANFYTWLYRIGFNLAITKINKSREHQIDEDFELTLKSDDNVVQNLTDRRLENKIIEDICQETNGIVVAANYNCPGQVVISGEVDAVKNACEKLSNAGARRALLLPVGGAFHSELMIDAKKELSSAINQTVFNQPSCPIYQNVNGRPELSVEKIKEFAAFIQKNGFSICIYPEGTRSRSGAMKPFKTAGVSALLDAAPDAVLVPLTINRAYQFTRKGLFPLQVGVRMEYIVHEPIENTGDKSAIIAQAEAAVRSALKE